MVLFADLVETSGRVGGVSARLAKVREIAAFLKSLAPAEIAIAVHYLSGDIPQGRIGVGPMALRSAVSQAPALVGTRSICAVDEALTEIAAIHGGGSGAERDTALRRLLSTLSAAEGSFLVRLLAGDLRQGALEGVMIDAIAATAGLPAQQIRRAAMYSKSLGAVADAALLEGAAGLSRFQLELFSPIAPMLAQTAADVDDALRQLVGSVAFEWKMDGARIQVHRVANDTRIYTRGLNEVTDAMPEIVAAVRAFAPSSLVLDGEAIAFDAAGRPHAFQTTMRRFGRRLKVNELATDLPIRAFFFDCLFLDGRDLTGLSTQERFQFLSRSVPESMQIPRRVTASSIEAWAFYRDALQARHEGVMAKSQDAPYEAGSRGASWLKIKRAHTLDLVVLGAEWGSGRRAGKLSNLHLGAIEPETGSYVMLGKTFKGLTDAMLDWQTEQFLRREIRRDGHTVYIKPEIVAEIAFSDLQTSSRYPGGFALRLARVKRYRQDKRPDEADTMDSIRKIYAGQS
ncbi:MAG TPA: ATP-dependent DNA ligase [Steroidobacteraceae bacterium]